MVSRLNQWQEDDPVRKLISWKQGFVFESRLRSGHFRHLVATGRELPDDNFAFSNLNKALERIDELASESVLNFAANSIGAGPSAGRPGGAEEIINDWKNGGEMSISLFVFCVMLGMPCEISLMRLAVRLTSLMTLPGMPDAHAEGFKRQRYFGIDLGGGEATDEILTRSFGLFGLAGLANSTVRIG